MMTENPNIFDFATSELSQDAFLAWLIQYADHVNADDETGAYAASRRFLDRAFERNSLAKPTGDLAISVLRQHYHIDVFAEITEVVTGKKYVLLLEDKAGTTIHDNQLARYRAVIKDNYADSKQVCVYCQTHNESVKKSVMDDGFCQLSRQDLLEVLKDSSGNQIIESFVTHLANIEDRTNEWERLPPRDGNGNDQWSWLAWQGFFMKLCKELGDGEWAYVPNPSGGFMGFWWHWRAIEGGSLYLLLEEGKACFKVEVGENVDAGEMKWTWNTLVLEKATEFGVEAIKPPVMRRGAWMTVAILKDDYRKVGTGGLIDCKETLRVLEDMMKVVDKVSKAWGTQD